MTRPASTNGISTDRRAADRQTAEEREPALAAIAALLGPRLTRSPSDREIHGRSESWYPPMPPDAVAYPETSEEVCRILEICSRHRLPVIPWGTGTSLEGQSIAPGGGLCLDLSRMNRVVEIDAENMLARVEPGVTRTRLNEELRATGLFFPVDPGADASLGGMASTRASGTTAVRYGTMRDNVKGLEVALADGRLIRTGSRARKSAAGYDLTALFVGAEGTLGIITELTLQLHGIPEAISAAVVSFPDMHAAVEAVMLTIQSGIPVARIEFLDSESVKAVNAHSGLALEETPLLLLEFHGSPRAVAEDAARFGEIATELGGRGFRTADRPEERNRLWDARHKAYYAILASRPGARAIVTDICVPISRLAEAVEETRRDIAASGLPGPILGHVGDGNFHAILLIDPNDEQELARAKALAHRMAERALALGGTVTGEHGVGLGKRPFMSLEHGEAWQLMGTLKTALDPAGILNPGKLVP